MSYGASIMENMAQLVCDCHLEWLPNFISTTRSTRPQFSIDIDGSVCSDQGGLSITSDSVDFSVCRGMWFCMSAYFLIIYHNYLLLHNIFPSHSYIQISAPWAITTVTLTQRALL